MVDRLRLLRDIFNSDENDSPEGDRAFQQLCMAVLLREPCYSRRPHSELVALWEARRGFGVAPEYRDVDTPETRASLELHLAADDVELEQALGVRFDVDKYRWGRAESWQ